MLTGDTACTSSDLRLPKWPRPALTQAEEIATRNRDDRSGQTIRTDAPNRSDHADPVDLWLAFPEQIRDAELWRAYDGLLSAEETARARHLLLEDKKRQFLLTRALVRCVLARYTGLSSTELEFQTGSHGRPELRYRHAPEHLIRFNIAHTDGLVVLAVTRDRAVGVDAEVRSNESRMKHVREHMLSSQERRSVDALARHRRPERMLQLWTLKESYAKALGLGCQLPFNAVTFDFHRDGSLRALLPPAVEAAEASLWSFSLLSASARHVMSVCMERGAGREPALTARTIVPLVSEQSCDFALLRQGTQVAARLQLRLHDNVPRDDFLARERKGIR